MNRILCFILGLLCASPTASAQNAPSTAQWQGTRTAGHGACFQNSGQGVTIQDAANQQCNYPIGLTITAPGYAITSNSPFAVPLLNENITAITGTYNSTSTTGIWQNYIGQFNVTKQGTAGISNTRLATIVGGPQQTGGFLNLSSVLFVNATADTTDSFYVSDVGQTTGQGIVGGTAGSPIGHVFGSNFYSRLTSGATNWSEEGGMEIDLSITSGASALYQEGIQVILQSDHATAAGNWSSGYIVAAQPGAVATLSCGYCAGGYQGQNAIAPTGTLFGFEPHASGAGYPNASVAYGVDLRGVDTTTAAWRGPNSTSLIDDQGNFTGASFNARSNNALNLGNVTNGPGIQIASGSAGATYVNLLLVTPSVTGQPLIMGPGGPSSDANINFLLNAKGTGFFGFSTGGGRQFQIIDTPGAVDFLNVTGGASGSSKVVLTPTGSDANINIQFAPKGSGVLSVGSNLGVTCSGAPTASFASSGGLVTHC